MEDLTVDLPLATELLEERPDFGTGRLRDKIRGESPHAWWIRAGAGIHLLQG